MFCAKSALKTNLITNPEPKMSRKNKKEEKSASEDLPGERKPHQEHSENFGGE